MSISVTSTIWNTCLFREGNCLTVMLALADWASDDGGDIYPGIDLLAAKARISVRTAQATLRHLEDLGVIVSLSDARGGRGKVTEYQIDLERVQELQGLHEAECCDCPSCAAHRKSHERRMHYRAQRVQRGAQKGASSDRKGAATGKKGAKTCSAYIEEPSITTIEPSHIPARERETVEKPSPGELIGAFPDIWRAFMAVPGASPLMSEAKAREALQRLIDQGVALPVPGEMIAAIGIYAAEVAALNAKRRSPIFIQHPHTWLTEKRWQQYLGAAREAQQTRQSLEACACKAAEGLGAAGFDRLRRAGITLAEIEAWFAGCVGEADGDTPVIVAASPFKAKEIEKQFGSRLRKADAFGPDLKITEAKRRAA